MSAVTDIADRLAAWEDGLDYGDSGRSAAASMADDIRTLLAAVGHADDDIPGPPTITTIIGMLERIRAHRGDLLVLVPAGDDPVPSYMACNVEIDDVLYDGIGVWAHGFASGEPSCKAVILR